MKGKVYSYLRFSSPAQSEGDSERRQDEAAREFAKANGLVFDDTLRMTDRGLSGYHGANRTKGALGAFLESVKSGLVPPGSVLVVENIDRLGREQITEALETIVSGLLKNGITIETLFPRDTYTKQSINTGGIWRLIAHIERAHAESQRKSDLAKANWKQKRKLAREQGKVLTRRAPAWLERADGAFRVIPEARETLTQIFKLKLEGFGKNAIARKLNESEAWISPKSPKRKTNGWRGSYVEKILRTRAVLGEFQPYRKESGKRVPDGEPIPGYYPALISADLYHAVQQRTKENAGNAGRTGKLLNVLRHLCRCGYCGGTMAFENKGELPKGGTYLVCDNGRRGAKNAQGQPICRPYSVRYEETARVVLENCPKLKPELVLPNSNEHAAEAKRVRERLAGLEGELASVDEQIENFIDQIGRTSNAAIRSRYEQRVEELETRKAQVKVEKAEVAAALQKLERSRVSFTDWQRNLEGLRKAINKDADSRVRLNTHLKEFIERIEVYAQGCEDSLEHAEAEIADNLPEIARAASYKSFRKFLRERLLSSEGRFLRVYFRNAKPSRTGLQIAPPESLAWRIEVQGKSWKFTGPAVSRLANEFFDGRKPGFVPKASLA